MGNIVTAGMTHNSVYLWTVPMVHCNGWIFTWSMSVVAGTHVCLRRITAKNIFDAIARYGVTHMGGAPTVMGFLINATEERSEEHTSELQSLMRISYAVFCLKKKKSIIKLTYDTHHNTTTPYTSTP